jgi:hypothetical protein
MNRTPGSPGRLSIIIDAIGRLVIIKYISIAMVPCVVIFFLDFEQFLLDLFLILNRYGERNKLTSLLPVNSFRNRCDRFVAALKLF